MTEKKLVAPCAASNMKETGAPPWWSAAIAANSLGIVLSPAFGAQLMSASAVIVAINARFLHLNREKGVAQ